MNKNEIYVGQVVRFRGGLAKVSKVNPKTIHITTDKGVMRRVSPYSLTDAPGESFVAASEDEKDLVRGELVRFKNPGSYGKGYYVVTGSRAGSYQVAVLGGDSGRYYTGISREAMEVVDFDLS